jgi:hypothetical protein
MRWCLCETESDWLRRSIWVCFCYIMEVRIFACEAEPCQLGFSVWFFVQRYYWAWLSRPLGPEPTGWDGVSGFFSCAKS